MLVRSKRTLHIVTTESPRNTHTKSRMLGGDGGTGDYADPCSSQSALCSCGSTTPRGAKLSPFEGPQPAPELAFNLPLD